MKEARILTFTGKVFDILNPDPALICIEDIAHALSNIGRYGGHTKRFYSVAEHSIYLSRIPTFKPLRKFQALLHDATEAYIGDIVYPFKKNLEHIEGIENRIWRAITEAIHLPPMLPPDVKAADAAILYNEMRDLMHPTEALYRTLGTLHTPLEGLTIPERWNNEFDLTVEEVFLQRYSELQSADAFSPGAPCANFEI